MQSLSDILGMLASLAIFLGVPLGLYQLITTSMADQQAKEEAVYRSLDEGFIDFQKLCLKHPYLDVFDVPDKEPIVLTEIQKKEELIAFTLLFSIFERAFLLYNKLNSQVMKGQWEGWAEYIDSYCQRENFRKAWKISGSTFDPRFQSFTEKAIKKYDHT